MKTNKKKLKRNYYGVVNLRASNMRLASKSKSYYLVMLLWMCANLYLIVATASVTDVQLFLPNSTINFLLPNQNVPLVGAFLALPWVLAILQILLLQYIKVLGIKSDSSNKDGAHEIGSFVLLLASPATIACIICRFSDYQEVLYTLIQYAALLVSFISVNQFANQTKNHVVRQYVVLRAFLFFFVALILFLPLFQLIIIKDMDRGDSIYKSFLRNDFFTPKLKLSLDVLSADAQYEKRKALVENNTGIKTNAPIYMLDMQNRSFKYAIMPYVQFNRTDFSGSDFFNAYMAGARLEGAIFDNARLQNAQLWRAGLQHATFKSAVLDNAELKGARLEGSNFKLAQLQAANLEYADLQNANFQGADAQSADFSGANLLKADFEKANLDKAFFSGSNLVEADFNYAQMRGAVLASAKIEGARFYKANLQNANLINTMADGADFAWAEMSEANFTNAQLKNAYLGNAIMQRAIFFDTNMQGANLRVADLQHAHFNNANLKAATFDITDLQGARFNRVNLESAILENITVDEKTVFEDCIVNENTAVLIEESHLDTVSKVIRYIMVEETFALREKLRSQNGLNLPAVLYKQLFARPTEYYALTTDGKWHKHFDVGARHL